MLSLTRFFCDIESNPYDLKKNDGIDGYPASVEKVIFTLKIKENLYYVGFLYADNYISHFTTFLLSGTGSKPPFASGLHLKSRLIIKKIATKNERLFKASIAYSLQVGVNAQLVFSPADTCFL